MWNKLSMADRAKYIQIGVQNGITDLSTIRKAYNTYAKGGYLDWKKKVREYKGIIIDGDDTYDYESYYHDDPDRAWRLLDKNSSEHFPDTYKTATHPTFSDESRYSGSKNRYNPNGITGGHWYGDNSYVMSQSQFDNDWDTDRTLDYLGQEDNPPSLYAPDGSTMLHSVGVTPQSSALNRSREATRPNTDFSNAQDMTKTQRFGATWLAGVPFLGIDPHTCLNTVTGFYDPNNTVASNPNMVAHPEDYGYKEINQSDAVPGDIIILSNKNNHPTHAVMFDSVSDKSGIHNGFPYEPGDTLVNYSNGGRSNDSYRLQGPLKRFDDPDAAHGDFSGSRRYFRFTGKGKK